MKIITKFVKNHPLAAVLILALVIRLVAVIFSQGFIQSDDFYDTVDVSYDWLRNGIQGDDGYLHWKEQPATSIARFPIYTYFLYLIMKLNYLFGITALDKMMYSIRFIHALLSLLPIWAIFRLTEKFTKDYKWAVWAATLAAVHFAMPFLGVRNLIEMVGGELWIVAAYFIYQYLENRDTKSLYWAGLFTGLAWMVRFQMAFAVIPLPFVLWYEAKNIRPAIHFSLAVAVMLFLAALSDKIFLGYWAASTVNNLTLNTGLGTVYKTVTLMYPLVLLAFFIPTFSLTVLYLFWQKEFWVKHRWLIISTLSFIIFHSAHPNQQERFMIPIVPVVMFLIVMAVWCKYKARGYILVKNHRLRTIIISVTLLINFILLVPLTFGYGHKGLIEPLIWIERMDASPRLMFIKPGMHRWVPAPFLGYKNLTRYSIRDWNDLHNLPDSIRQSDFFDYFIFYPERDEDLAACVDSMTLLYGNLQPVKTFEPSLYDRIFNRLNPRHYSTYKAFVYTPEKKRNVKQGY